MKLSKLYGSDISEIEDAWRFFYLKQDITTCTYSVCSQNYVLLIQNTKPHFTSTLIVTSHESNACSVFATQMFVCATRNSVGITPALPAECKRIHT